MTGNLKFTADRAAVVDKKYHWIPISKDHRPPQGGKLQLINRRNGCATYGNWTPGSEWTHYAGLPTFDPNDKTGL